MRSPLAGDHRLVKAEPRGKSMSVTPTASPEAPPLTPEPLHRMLGEAGFGAPEVHEGRGMPSRFLIASPR